MKKYGDLICGAVCAVVAVAVFVMSVQIGMKESAAIGADFLPKIVAVILLVFSLVLMRSGWKTCRTYQEETPEFPPNGKGVLIMLAALVLYAAALKPVGFILTSLVFVFLAIVLMSRKEETNYVKFAIISVVAVLAIYLIFTRFFGIRLPRGIISFL